MSNQGRREIILALLEEKGKVYVSELAKDMNVSEKTIRRDLTKMEQEGVLIRSHGGAIRPDGTEHLTFQLPETTKELEDEERRISNHPMDKDESEKSNENIKKEQTSKPEWLVKAIENARPSEKNIRSADEEIEISQSGSVMEPINSLRDLNLKELEKSIPPDTLAELMKLAYPEIEMESKAASLVGDDEREEELVEDEFEDDELIDEELDVEVLSDEELVEDEFEDDELIDEELDVEVLSEEELVKDEFEDDELIDEELDVEDQSEEELAEDEFEDDELIDEELDVEDQSDEELADDELEDDELTDEELNLQELSMRESAAKGQHYDMADIDYEIERVERSGRLAARARKDRQGGTVENKKKPKSPKGKNKTMESGGRKKHQSEKTKKPSTIRTVLDWLHIIVALIIFIGGIILAFYIIQTNRAQNLIINESDSKYEYVIYEELNAHLTVDEHLLEDDNGQNEVIGTSHHKS